MNRREFLKSLLGSAAIVAMPATVLAIAEQECAPLADILQAWTPSDYFFSVWIKRDKAIYRSTILGVDGLGISGTKPMWERIGFKISKELGDAMSSNSLNCAAGYQCLQRVLRIVGQERAEMMMAQLELNPFSPQFIACQFSAEPFKERLITNLVTNSSIKAI